MGRINKSGKTVDKESYSYYKKYFSAMKSYYKKKGWDNLIPEKMTEEEWKAKKDTGRENKDILYDEFHQYSKEASESLAEKFGVKATKANIARIGRGDFTEEEKESIRDAYYARKQELIDQGVENASAQASKDVHFDYWGS